MICCFKHDVSLRTSEYLTATGNLYHKQNPCHSFRCLLLSPTMRWTQEWLHRPRAVDLSFAQVSDFSYIVGWLVGMDLFRSNSSATHQKGVIILTHTSKGRTSFDRISTLHKRSNAALYGTTQQDRGTLPQINRYIFARGRASHTSSQRPAQPASAPPSRRFSSHQRCKRHTCNHDIPAVLLYDFLRQNKYLLYVGCYSCYCKTNSAVSHIHWWTLHDMNMYVLVTPKWYKHAYINIGDPRWSMLHILVTTMKHIPYITYPWWSTLHILVTPMKHTPYIGDPWQSTLHIIGDSDKPCHINW
jgi:hypothetical protein